MGAANCAATPVASTTFTAFEEPGGGGYTSILLAGYAAVPADAGTVPPYTPGLPADAGPDAGPQPVSGGLSSLAMSIVKMEDDSWAETQASSLRLVNLDVDHPTPMTLHVTQTAGAGRWDLDDVPYGGFSTHPPPTDPFGYITMAPGPATLSRTGVRRGRRLR